MRPSADSGVEFFESRRVLELYMRYPGGRDQEGLDRTYRDIALYRINQESRRIACISYGVPVPAGLPFNPLRDELHLNMEELERRAVYVRGLGRGNGC